MSTCRSARTDGDGETPWPFLAVAGLQAGDAGELGEVRLSCSFWLECMAGSSARNDHQARLGAGHRRVHEGIGGARQADVLMVASRAPA